MLTFKHAELYDTLKALLDNQGFKYYEYSDGPEDTSYDLVDGKSIKFWRVFPMSGDKLDRVIFTANQLLNPLGLYLATHIHTYKTPVLQNVTVPMTNGKDVRCQGYVNKDVVHFSLLVKQLPELL